MVCAAAGLAAQFAAGRREPLRETEVAEISPTSAVITWEAS